jgi:hypothetical protein
MPEFVDFFDPTPEQQVILLVDAAPRLSTRPNDSSKDKGHFARIIGEWLAGFLTFSFGI